MDSRRTECDISPGVVRGPVFSKINEQNDAAADGSAVAAATCRDAFVVSSGRSHSRGRPQPFRPPETDLGAERSGIDLLLEEALRSLLDDPPPT